jgi:hypothetical protein
MNNLTAVDSSKSSGSMRGRNLGALIFCLLVMGWLVAPSQSGGQNARTGTAQAQPAHEPVPSKPATAPQASANPGKTRTLIRDSHGVDHYIMVGGDGREGAQGQRGSQSADFPTKPAAFAAPGTESPEMQKPAALRAGPDGTPLVGHTNVTVKQLHDRMRQRKQEQSDRLRSEQEKSQQQSEGDDSHPQ